MLQLGASIARLQPDASTQGFAKTGFEYQALATRNAGQTGPRPGAYHRSTVSATGLSYE
jgi:hypothetical protein